jgi:hypothetical protein
MLAAQMAAVHNTMMTFARRLNHVENIPQQDSAERAFNKLARTFAAQVEALKRYRTGGQQKVTVEHVTVNAGGQAIVGNVETPGGGAPAKSKDQPHALAHAPGPTLQARSRSGKPCRSPAVKGSRVCRMHGTGGGAPKGNRNAWRHGLYSAEAIDIRRHIRALARQARKLIQAVD